ncbi:N-6 DNA methylase [Nonomuraea roseoviolacea]|uniref:N-6 DNA methylase n=1 Tax=Nonomuraea roseoviolacea TaxID=103837 RepID=UPI0031CDBB3F
MSNWERRHADYPRPIRLGADEVFQVQAIAAWLDGRLIPRNALLEGERPGTTYGARFRMNLARSGDPGELPSEAGQAPADMEALLSGPHGTEKWRKVLDRLDVAHDLARHPGALLALVYARARDSGWAAVAAGSVDPLDWAERALERLSPVGGRTITTSRPGRETLRYVVALADEAVRDIGGAQAFRMLLDRFAAVEGGGGEGFYTPESVAHVLIDAVRPEQPAEIYDASSRAGELLVAAASDLLERGAEKETLSLHGATLSEESSALARMNVRLHGMDAHFETHDKHALCRDAKPGTLYPYIVANPPFSMGGWCDDDPASCRTWRYGPPPRHNANFAWIQYILERLSPDGRAAVLMPNNAMFSTHPKERAIRRGMVEDGQVRALIALPDRLFPATSIGTTVWILGREESRSEILFVDAWDMGRMVDRTRRELSREDHTELDGILTAWRAGVLPPGPASRAVVVPVEEVSAQDYNLNPRRYVTSASAVPSGSREAVLRLRTRLERLHAEALDADTRAERELRRLGW